MKLTFMAAAAAALLMAACTSNQKQTNDTTATPSASDNQEVVYAGVLPAADAAGIQYTLTLDYDDDNNSGDYSLIETTLDYDSVSPAGYKNGAVFTSKGDFTVEEATPATNGKKYLKLVEDTQGAPGAGPIYFLIDSGSAITMVGEDLQPAASPDMNYTLTIQE